MKAAMVEGEGKVVLRDVPKPVPDKDEVLVRVQYCGVCGSDLHRWREGARLGIGHEFSGDIVEVGSEVKGWSVGDRVAINPHRACGECRWCRRGREIGLCETFFDRIQQWEGAFRTYARAKHYQAHRLRDDLSYEHAAVTEPAAVALHAVRLAEMQEGDVVAVLGMGPIGQLIARVARALGAGAVYATEKSPSRIELARGAVNEVVDVNAADPVARILELTGGEGPDIVFECTGDVAATQQSLLMVRKGGTIVAVAICFDWVQIPFSHIVLKGLTLKGYVCFSVGDYADALRLIAEKKIDVAPLLTCRMPLDDIEEAFQKATRCEGGTILIKP